MKYKKGDIINCKFNFELGLDGEAWLYIGTKEDAEKQGVSDDDIFAYVDSVQDRDIINGATVIEIIDKVKRI